MSRRLLIFVRDPRPGRVKTRLAAGVGDRAAADLYRHFVLDTLATACRVRAAPAIVYHPPDAGPRIGRWLGSGFDRFPQQGRTPGQRMRNALADSFRAGCRKVVLVGSDTPDLTPALLEEAFTVLNHVEAVVGPAGNGGCYLIGFEREGFEPCAFRGAGRRRGEACADMLAVLAARNRTFHLLPELRNIDTFGDLLDFYGRRRRSGSLATIRCIRSRPRIRRLCERGVPGEIMPPPVEMTGRTHGRT